MNNTKLYNIPFWSIVSAFCLGIFLSKSLNYPLAHLLVLLGGLVFLYFKKQELKATLFLGIASVLFLCLGGIRYEISKPQYNANHIVTIAKPLQRQQIVLTINKELKPSQNYLNFRATVNYVNSKKTTGQVLLSIKKMDNNTIPLGSSFISITSFKKLTPQNFPYSFNYTTYLYNQNITHRIWSTKSDLIPIHSLAPKAKQFLYTLQNKLLQNLENSALTTKSLQMIKTLIFGKKVNLDPQLKSDFTNAGVIHILAISGLHIGIIYGILILLLQFLTPYYHQRIFRSIIILIGLWAFTWFSGASNSALRATTMFSCFELSRLLFRKQHPLNSLFLSVFILVFINPLTLFSVGFQLSITAVASILIFTPKLLLWWKPKNYIISKIWQITAISLCAQLGILPLSIYYFHQFPLLFLVANIPIMLIISTIILLAFFIVTYSGFNTINKWFAATYNQLIELLLNYIHWIAQYEQFILKNLYISEYAVVFCYLLLLGGIIGLFKHFNHYIFIALSLCIILYFFEINQSIFKKELWLLNDYMNTTFVEVMPRKILTHSNKELSSAMLKYNLNPLMEKLHITTLSKHSLKNNYYYKGNTLHIINDKSLFPKKEYNAIVVLDNSPKINLDRLLLQKPKIIIATAKNYSYLIKKWKATCLKHQIAFYSIQEQGSVNIEALID